MRTTPWTAPAGIDPECRLLCEAMCAFPGIRTIESCCGHGRQPFKVWFLADSLAALPHLLYWFDSCHSGVPGWRVYVHTDCGRSPACFVAEGPVGDFAGAVKTAMAMQPDGGAEGWGSVAARRRALHTWLGEREEHEGLRTREIVDLSGIYFRKENLGHNVSPNSRADRDLKALAERRLVRCIGRPARWYINRLPEAGQ